MFKKLPFYFGARLLAIWIIVGILILDTQFISDAVLNEISLRAVTILAWLLVCVNGLVIWFAKHLWVGRLS